MRLLKKWSQKRLKAKYPRMLWEIQQAKEGAFLERGNCGKKSKKKWLFGGAEMKEGGEKKRVKVGLIRLL